MSVKIYVNVKKKHSIYNIVSFHGSNVCFFEFFLLLKLLQKLTSDVLRNQGQAMFVIDRAVRSSYDHIVV